MPFGLATGGSSSVTLVGTRATVEHLLPHAEHAGVRQEVETVEELPAQEGLHQVQAPGDLHVLVPVTDLAYCAGQIRAELCGPSPRKAGPAAGGHVLRDAVERRGDLVVLEACGGRALPQRAALPCRMCVAASDGVSFRPTLRGEGPCAKRTKGTAKGGIPRCRPHSHGPIFRLTPRILGPGN